MLHLTTPNGWINHALGLSTLIESQGPYSFQSEPQHTIFLTSRFNIILASLASQRSTFLSKAEWKIIPWQHKNTAKDDMEHLLDIVADIPSLRPAIHGGCDPMVIRQIACSLLHSLHSWMDCWKAQPNHVISSNRCDSSHDIQPPCSGIHLAYRSLSQANEVCLYNAAVIQIIEILRSMECGLDYSHELSTEVTQLLYRAATDICRSIEYQVNQSSSLMLGQLFVLYPLRMTWLAFGRNSTIEGQWVEKKMVEIRIASHRWEIASQAITLDLGDVSSDTRNAD